MSTDTEILLGLIAEANARVIHYQEERTNTTNIIFVIATALIGIILSDGSIENFDWILAILIILSGTLGALLTAKYHERIYFHGIIFDKYVELLDKETPALAIAKVISEAKDTIRGPKDKNTTGNAKGKRRKFTLNRFLYYTTLWKAWVVVNALVILIGIVILMIALFPKS
jgi:uncharacterized membrane protein YbhN (UPF0104 family)